MFAIIFPPVDPIFINIGPIAIRWYGLAYAFSIICCYLLLRGLYPRTPANSRLLDDIVFFSALGIILGGRLGYVLFYHLEWFWTDPLRIFAIWQGGMSFHGGLLGVIIALYLASLKHRKPFLYNCDRVSCVAPIGLFFGRIANFINAELWGRKTNIAWGVLQSDGSIRHASQLYEAMTEGFLLFLIMVTCYKSLKFKQGALSGLFFMGYSLFRILMENFREPDDHIGFYLGSITQGQILSLPMLIIGGCLFYKAYYRPNKEG